MTKTLITPSGRVLLPGLRMDNAPSSAWQKLTQEQQGSCFDGLKNVFRLKNLDGLQGVDKFKAQMGNILAAYYNPFATFEMWRHLGSGYLV